MANSGVKVADECITVFGELKKPSKNKQDRLKYVLFKLNKDNTEIEVEKSQEVIPGADNKKEWSDFKESLPADESRYAVFDFHFSLGEDGSRTKLLFVVWCPDNVTVKQKMLYASSKSTLKQKLVGVSTEIQANGLDDLDFDTVMDKAKKSSN